MLSLAELPHYHLVPKPAWAPGLPVTHLLHCRQALELRTAEVVLLLQGRRLQHEVLLLCSVHLLQVLRSRTGLPVQGLLDHLRSVGWVGGHNRSVRVLHLPVSSVGHLSPAPAWQGALPQLPVPRCSACSAGNTASRASPRTKNTQRYFPPFLAISFMGGLHRPYLRSPNLWS